MITISDACKIALKEMPGYQIVSASEVESGWLFSFSLPDNSTPDMSPMLVTKETGEVQSYTFEDHIMEILTAKPIELAKIESQ